MDVFTAFGLAASAGLNAYIPLLVVSLLGKVYGPDQAGPTMGYAGKLVGDRDSGCSIGGGIFCR